MHLGIDYGSKLAGTTAISYLNGTKIVTVQSEKKKDADAFIHSIVDELQPKMIFIDAPLSLPLAYFNKGADFHFRECDKELKAMSPLFLGGLTARAMRLKSELELKGIKVYECYPKALVGSIEELKADYQKKNLNHLPAFILTFNKLLPHTPQKLTNWHQVDATLAWWTGNRYNNKIALQVGNKAEGLITY